jgi:hypothetical protein
VTAPGHAPQGRRIDLAETPPPIEVPLEPDPGAALREPGPPGAPAPPLEAAARALGLELVLVDVAGEGARREVTAADAATGRTARAAGAADAPRVALALVDQLLEIEPSPRERRRPSRVPWIVAGATAGVAAVVVTILAVVFTRPQDDAWEAEVSW